MRRRADEGNLDRMPETWRDLADASRTAAYELFQNGRWRSCASRAYYAVYSDATRVLLSVGTTMPANQNNPKHKAVPSLLAHNAHPLGLNDRWRLSGLVTGLYNFRVIADYVPATTLDGADARVAMGLMVRSFALLRRVP